MYRKCNYKVKYLTVIYFAIKKKYKNLFYEKSLNVLAITRAEYPISSKFKLQTVIKKICEIALNFFYFQ